MAPDEARLKPNLYDWQIIFIVLSAVVGNGIFYNDGEALEVAGPGGLLLAVVIMGVVAIFVMEGVSEFVQLFPVSNAIVEYVRAFVDEDFAWLVGIAYWYTFSTTFAAQNIAAAQHSRFWGLSQTWQTIVFYVLAPIVTLIINLFGVFFYGVFESIGGVLKVCLVLGVSVFLYAIADKENVSPNPINAGLQHDSQITPNQKQAMCYVLPLVTFSFIGVEIVAVTAPEAKNRRALRIPSRTIAYVVLLLYFLCTLGVIVNVDWTNKHLPAITLGTGSDVVHSQSDTSPATSSAVIIAALSAGKNAIPGFLNGCFIFSTLSGGNTALYVASRTLYGLASQSVTTNKFGRILRTFSIVESWTRPGSRWDKLFGGVPITALFASAAAFAWLPYLQLHENYDIDTLTEVIAISSSVSCVIVWAALSLAFIRYWYWLRICNHDVKSRFREYDRDDPKYQAMTFLRKLQPIPAILGFLGCLIILGFSTATWWNTQATFSKIAGSIGAPVVLFILFIFFKLWALMTMSFTSWKARWVRLADIDRLEQRWRRFELWSKEERDTQRTCDKVQEDMIRGAGKQIVGENMQTPSTADFEGFSRSTNFLSHNRPERASSAGRYGCPVLGGADENEVSPALVEIDEGRIPLRELPSG